MLTVYEAEELDGLGELLRGTAAVTFEAPALPRASLVPSPGSARASNLDQPDLYAFRSQLVRTGFNLNGDFFTAADTWAARATPEDKPINYRHNMDEVVGHITDVEVLDAEGKAVDSDEAPESFAVWDVGVVYRLCGSDTEQERRDQLIADIAAGDEWVSMECLFNDFDYVLVPAAASFVEADLSKAQFVKRNKATAFLTKYLRGFGGTGRYDDGRMVGRVFRDFVFSGKGFVRKPANPTSAVYAMDGTPLSGKSTAAVTTFPAPVYVIPKEPQLNELEQLRKQVADLQAQVAQAATKDLANKVVELEDQLKTAQAALKAETDKVAEAVKAAAEASEAAKAELAAKALELEQAVSAKTQVETALASVTTERDALKAEADKVAAEAAATELLGRVKESYGCDDEKAKAVAETLKALDPAKLDEHLKAVAAMKPAKPPQADLSKPDVMGSGPKVVKVIGLAGAVPEPSDAAADLTVSGESAVASEAQAGLQADIKNLMSRGRKASK